MPRGEQGKLSERLQDIQAEKDADNKVKRLKELFTALAIGIGIGKIGGPPGGGGEKPVYDMEAHHRNYRNVVGLYHAERFASARSAQRKAGFGISADSIDTQGSIAERRLGMEAEQRLGKGKVLGYFSTDAIHQKTEAAKEVARRGNLDVAESALQDIEIGMRRSEAAQGQDIEALADRALASERRKEKGELVNQFSEKPPGQEGPRARSEREIRNDVAASAVSKMEESYDRDIAELEGSATRGDRARDELLGQAPKGSTGILRLDAAAAMDIYLQLPEGSRERFRAAANRVLATGSAKEYEEAAMGLLSAMVKDKQGFDSAAAGLATKIPQGDERDYRGMEKQLHAEAARQVAHGHDGQRQVAWSAARIGIERGLEDLKRGMEAAKQRASTTDRQMRDTEQALGWSPHSYVSDSHIKHAQDGLDFAMAMLDQSNDFRGHDIMVRNEEISGERFFYSEKTARAGREYPFAMTPRGGSGITFNAADYLESWNTERARELGSYIEDSDVRKGADPGLDRMARDRTTIDLAMLGVKRTWHPEEGYWGLSRWEPEDAKERDALNDAYSAAGILEGQMYGALAQHSSSWGDEHVSRFMERMDKRHALAADAVAQVMGGDAPKARDILGSEGGDKRRYAAGTIALDLRTGADLDEETRSSREGMRSYQAYYNSTVAVGTFAVATAGVVLAPFTGGGSLVLTAGVGVSGITGAVEEKEAYGEWTGRSYFHLGMGIAGTLLPFAGEFAAAGKGISGTLEAAEALEAGAVETVAQTATFSQRFGQFLIGGSEMSGFQRAVHVTGMSMMAGGAGEFGYEFLRGGGLLSSYRAGDVTLAEFLTQTATGGIQSIGIPAVQALHGMYRAPGVRMPAGGIPEYVPRWRQVARAAFLGEAMVAPEAHAASRDMHMARMELARVPQTERDAFDSFISANSVEMEPAQFRRVASEFRSAVSSGRSFEDFLRGNHELSIAGNEGAIGRVAAGEMPISSLSERQFAYLQARSRGGSAEAAMQEADSYIARVSDPAIRDAEDVFHSVRRGETNPDSLPPGMRTYVDARFRMATPDEAHATLRAQEQRERVAVMREKKERAEAERAERHVRLSFDAQLDSNFTSSDRGSSTIGRGDASVKVAKDHVGLAHEITYQAENAVRRPDGQSLDAAVGAARTKMRDQLLAGGRPPEEAQRIADERAKKVYDLAEDREFIKATVGRPEPNRRAQLEMGLHAAGYLPEIAKRPDVILATEMLEARGIIRSEGVTTADLDRFAADRIAYADTLHEGGTGYGMAAADAIERSAEALVREGTRRLLQDPKLTRARFEALISESERRAAELEGSRSNFGIELTPLYLDRVEQLRLEFTKRMLSAPRSDATMGAQHEDIRKLTEGLPKEVADDATLLFNAAHGIALDKAGMARVAEILSMDGLRIGPNISADEIISLAKDLHLPPSADRVTMDGISFAEERATEQAGQYALRAVIESGRIVTAGSDYGEGIHATNGLWFKTAGAMARDMAVMEHAHAVGVIERAITKGEALPEGEGEFFQTNALLGNGNSDERGMIIVTRRARDYEAAADNVRTWIENERSAGREPSPQAIHDRIDTITRLQGPHVNSYTIAIDKSGLGDIDRTAGYYLDESGHRVTIHEGHDAASVISRELFGDMMYRMADILEARAKAQRGVITDGDIDIAMKTVKEEVMGSRRIPDDRVGAISDARDMLRASDIAEREAAARENRGFRPITREQEIEASMAALRKSLGREPEARDLEEALGYLHTPDPRTYRTQVGPDPHVQGQSRTMTLEEYAQEYLGRGNEMLAAFAYGTANEPMRPGDRQSGDFGASYERAEERQATYTHPIAESLGIPVSGVHAVTGIDGKGIPILFRSDTIAQGSTVTEVRFRLTESSGRETVRENIDRQVESTLQRSGSFQRDGRILALRNEYRISENEAARVLDAHESGTLTPEVFFEAVPRKGILFARGEWGFSEGNTALGHYGMNYLVQAVTDAAAAIPGARFAGDNLTVVFPPGTPPGAVREFYERVNSLMPKTGPARSVEARGSPITLEREGTVDEIKKRSAAAQLGVDPSSVDALTYIVHSAHPSGRGKIFTALFGDNADYVMARYGNLSRSQRVDMLGVPGVEMEPLLLASAVEEIRTTRSLRRPRDVLATFEDRSSSAESEARRLRGVGDIPAAERSEREAAYWKGISKGLTEFALQYGDGYIKRFNGIQEPAARPGNETKNLTKGEQALEAARIELFDAYVRTGAKPADVMAAVDNAVNQAKRIAALDPEKADTSDELLFALTNKRVAADKDLPFEVAALHALHGATQDSIVLANESANGRPAEPLLRIGYDIALIKARSEGRAQISDRDFLFGAIAMRVVEPFAEQFNIGKIYLISRTPPEGRIDAAMAYIKAAGRIEAGFRFGATPGEPQKSAAESALKLLVDLHAEGFSNPSALFVNGKNGILEVFPTNNSFDFNRMNTGLNAIETLLFKTSGASKEVREAAVTCALDDARRLPKELRGGYLQALSKQFDYARMQGKVEQLAKAMKEKGLSDSRLPLLLYTQDPTGTLVKALDTDAVRSEFRSNQNFRNILQLSDKLNYAGSEGSEASKAWASLVKDNLEGLAALPENMPRKQKDALRKEFTRELVPRMNELYDLFMGNDLTGEQLVSMAGKLAGKRTAADFMAAIGEEYAAIVPQEMGITKRFAASNPSLIFDLATLRKNILRYISTSSERPVGSIDYFGRAGGLDEVPDVLDLSIAARVGGEDSFRDFKFSKGFLAELEHLYGADTAQNLFPAWRSDAKAEVEARGSKFEMSETGNFEDGFYGGRVRGEDNCQDPKSKDLHVSGIVGTIELPWIKQIPGEGARFQRRLAEKKAHHGQRGGGQTYPARAAAIRRQELARKVRARRHDHGFSQAQVRTPRSGSEGHQYCAEGRRRNQYGL